MINIYFFTKLAGSIFLFSSKLKNVHTIDFLNEARGIFAITKSHLNVQSHTTLLTKHLNNMYFQHQSVQIVKAKLFYYHQGFMQRPGDVARP